MIGQKKSRGQQLQIVSLWKAPYYGLANEKHICINPFFGNSRRHHAAMQVPLLE